MTELISGRYEPLRLLGSGSSAKVFEVRDRFLGGPTLALKRLPAAHTAQVLEEFRRLRAFRHPGIPQVGELGIDPPTGELFFTAELGRGPDFLTALRGAPVELQLRAVADLLRTLALLDEREVVHRDLKPQNLLVQGGEEPRVLVLDFGLATIAGGARELAGSLPWLAPELFRGEPASHRSDLYSLGVVLFELWTGRRPFVAETPVEWARAHCDRAVEFPPDARLAAPLREVVLRLLEKDPARRYPHAAEVLADLSRASAAPLPSSTPRALLGRVRSVPRFEPPWQATLEPGDVRVGGPITWVTAPTRAGRDELVRDLRAAAIVGEAFPVLVTFAPAGADALAPRAALVTRLRSLVDDAGAGRSDAELLELLRTGRLPRRVILFLDEVDRRTTEQEPLLRFLLQASAEIVASSGGGARDDPLVASCLPPAVELRTLSPRPVTLEEVTSAFPAWVGGVLPDSLARFLAIGRELDTPQLVQTLAYLVESGALDADEGGVRFDPSRVDLRDAGSDLFDVLRRRVARVGGSRRAALQALAILEVDADRAEIAALAPEADDAALGEIAAAGLVESVGERLRCAGAGVAAALLDALRPEQARELHRRAADHLARTPDVPDASLRQARHSFRARRDAASAAAFARAGVKLLIDHRLAEAEAVAREVERESSDAAALPIAALVRGVVELRRGSHAAAEQLLAPLPEALAEPALRARALTEHARALHRCGRPADGLARLDGAPKDLLEIAPGARALRAYLLHEMQRDAEAEAACREALAQPLPSQDEPVHRLHAMHAVTLWRLDRPAEARRAFETAIGAARAVEQPVAVAAIENNLARFEDDCGRFGLAVEIFRRALAASAAFADRQQECMVAYNLGATLFELGRSAEAKRELERARAIAHAMSRPAMLRRIALQQAQVALREGDRAAAQSSLDESLRLAREGGDARGEWLAELVRSEAHVYDGRPKAARALLRRLAKHRLVHESPELARYLAEYRLLWATIAGSRRAVERALAATSELPNSWKRRVHLRDARIAALVRLRRRDLLAVEAQRQLEELGEGELVAPRAHALAALAFAAEGRAAPEELRALAEKARAALAAVQAPGLALSRAQAAVVLGSALGDAALLAEAEELARRRGHRPLARRAAAARRRLGTRPGGEAADAPRHAALVRLMAVAKEIGATTDGEALLRFVLDHAIESTRARRGFLILAGDGHPSVRAARNLGAADIEQPELAFSSSVARLVARDGNPVLLSDVSADERFRDAASISQLKLISVLCVPLRNRTTIFGSLYLDDPTRIDAFSERELRYVEDLSDFAAIALEKAELLRANRERQAELERTQQEIERLNRELQAALLENQSELREARASLDKARRQVARALDFEGIVSQSAVMEEVKRKIELFADSGLPVFISGESGTGKELVARALHRKSDRRTRPYESLNCASMQPHLIENELFGHLRGAFTGADSDQAGLFERVAGGTLFLDEVCDASLELQAKLLRVVQFGEVQRLGGGAVRKVDVRIVAASNREVQKEVAAARFREDLMYRLVVLGVQLPPLRDHREDIPLLIEHFERRHAAKAKAQPLRFSPPAWKSFIRYGWPGNVRELENAVLRLLVLHREGDEIVLERLKEELPAAFESEPVESLRLREFMEHQERTYLLDVLSRLGGNRARAARELGISERSLYLKLQRFRDGAGPPKPDAGGEESRTAAT